MNKENVYYATGKRKNAIAKTWLAPGSGVITINDRTVENYFPIESLVIRLRQPLFFTNSLDSYDIKVRVNGGGLSGQAGAIRHGIAKALLIVDPELRAKLKKGGFLTRDSKIKERKKYGRKGARAKFQFSKR